MSDGDARAGGVVGRGAAGAASGLDAAERDAIALAFARIAAEAGRAILTVYASDFAVQTKADRSPVTEADERAEALILPALERLLPGTPVISEESFTAGARSALGTGPWVLVDPLDGTREFVSRNGDFTVNIALIADGRPVAGCVYAPARERVYVGGGRAQAGALAPGADPATASFSPIATRAPGSAGLIAVASRSHRDAETDAFLARLAVADTRSVGSSLKFCLVAEGLADVYPRFGPTMEWDTAAGHAVLLAAGGDVLTPAGGDFAYGKVGQGLRNGPFVAWSGALLPGARGGGPASR